MGDCSCEQDGLGFAFFPSGSARLRSQEQHQDGGRKSYRLQLRWILLRGPHNSALSCEAYIDDAQAGVGDLQRTRFVCSNASLCGQRIPLPVLTPNSYARLLNDPDPALERL